MNHDIGLAWLDNLKKMVYEFVCQMNTNNDVTYFKYSYSCDLYRHNIKWGLDQHVFATKILYMLDKINDLNNEHRLNSINAINSFYTEVITKNNF